MRGPLTYNEKKLFDAIDSDDIKSVKQALTGDDKHPAADVNCETEWNTVPVFRAIRRKNLKILKFLAERGADLEYKTATGETPLLAAVDNSWVDGIRFLLDSGIAVNRKTALGESPVLRAARYSDLPVLQVLETYGADFSARRGNGRTALALVAEGYFYNKPAEKRIKAAQFLIEKGVDINLTCMEYIDGNSVQNRTPLMIAARNGDVELMYFFVEQGAQVDCQDSFHSTALLDYCGQKYGDNVEPVQFLLDNGADKTINVVDEAGDTAILKAVRREKYQIAECLAQRGARLNVRDSYGYTVYDYIGDKHPELIAELKGIQQEQANQELIETVSVKTGDELFLMVEQDSTLLQRLVNVARIVDAFEKMSYDQTMILYQRIEKTISDEMKKQLQRVIRNNREKELTRNKPMPEINTQPSVKPDKNKHHIKNIYQIPVLLDGYPPMGYAIAKKDFEMLKYIVENGGYKEEPLLNKNTPLIAAAEGNWLEGVQYLLTQGVRVNARNNTGYTAVCHAAENNNIEMLKLLAKHNADFGIADKNERTPLIMISNILKPAENPDTVVDTARFLIERGVDVNRPSALVWEQDCTPLIKAVLCKNLPLVRCLIENGADVNARYSKHKQTVIMLAAELRQYDIVQCLAQHGCELDLRDAKGKTVFDYIKDNQLLTIELKNIYQKQAERKVIEAVSVRTGDELFYLSECNAQFLQQLVTTGMVVDAFKKMTYDQTLKLYKKSEKLMPYHIKTQVQTIIRDNRQKE